MIPKRKVQVGDNECGLSTKMEGSAMADGNDEWMLNAKVKEDSDNSESKFARRGDLVSPIVPSCPSMTTVTDTKIGSSIELRMSTLQKNGTNDWKLRLGKEQDLSFVSPNSGISLIKERMARLVDSGDNWQKRIGEKDAKELTVDGRLEKAGLVVKLATNRNVSSAKKVAPTTNVPVPMNLDDGFMQFYARAECKSSTESTFDMALDSVPLSDVILLNQPKSGVRPPPRKTIGSQNPLKTLASGNLTRDSYTDSQSPVIFRTFPVETTRPTTTMSPLTGFRPISGIRNSQLADEAVRALAATEDFSKIRGLLQRPDFSNTPGQSANLRPYKDPMFIQIRGRKFVDLRLVSPTFDSLHDAGCFLLITQMRIFLFDGQFANVLEKAKTREVASYIIEENDLGCNKASHLIEIDQKLPRPTTGDGVLFWTLLGTDFDSGLIRLPGDMNDEDQFEDVVASMTRVFQVTIDDQPMLILRTDLSGRRLNYSVFESNKVFIFDFGVEVYIWTGRVASHEMKQAAYELAKNDVFDLPFLCSSPQLIFGPDSNTLISRPSWCLFGTVKERMETCLFRAKFVDWPEMAALRSVTVRPFINGGQPECKKRQILAFKDPSTVEMSPEELACNLVNRTRKEPNLVLEDTSLGRGRKVENQGKNRQTRFEVFSEEIRMYRVSLETDSPIQVDPSNFGHFCTNQCVIVHWQYRVSYSDVRSLNGSESQHKKDGDTGRSRAVFFYWIGADSTRSLQGVCAMNVRDLNKLRHPHVRMAQGLEPPAFLALFRGRMVLHSAVNDDHPADRPVRLFALLGGPYSYESCIVEFPITTSLRSQAVYLIIRNSAPSSIAIWAGSLSPKQSKISAEQIAQYLCSSMSINFEFVSKPTIEIYCENKCQLVGFGMGPVRIERPIDFDNNWTLRLIRVSSIGGSGQFGAVETVSSSYSAEVAHMFPYEQDDLYGASQPAFFLLDQSSRLWLWEGFIDADDKDEAVVQKMRLHRLFALKLAVSYWRGRHSNENDQKPAFVVHAGLEPPEFTALFPIWTVRREARQWSIEHGHKENAKQEVNSLLSELRQYFYPISILRNRPLPDGVDSSRLESYLSEEEFEQSFAMSKEIFYDLPQWKQTRLKKECDLF